MSSKIAVVTGAGGGIGGAITARLIQDKFHVIALDLNTDNLEKLKAIFPNDVTTFAVDLTSAEKISEVFKRIWWGRCSGK
jgi:NADP-dependent 3-hydroxy acid dehydrogenase YdfG